MRRAMLTAARAPAVPATFVSAGATTSNLSAIAKPASVAVGDTVYIAIAVQLQTAIITPPTGFSTVGTITDSGHTLGVYSKALTGSEGSTFSASESTGSTASAVAVAYRHCSPTARATSTYNPGGFGSTLTYSAVASVAGDAVIGFATDRFGESGTTPTGHAERVDANPDTMWLQVVDILSAAGAASGANATLDDSVQGRLTIRGAFEPA